MRERSTGDPASPVAAPLSLAAFTALVDERQAALYAFLHGLLGDDEQARDLTQDTFHDAWLATQAGAAPWATTHDAEERHRWLFRTAYYRAISQLRRRTVIRWASLDRADPRGRDAADDANAPTPLAGLVDRSAPFEQRVVEAEALRAALARLHPDDAACLLLRVAQGFSAAEAAEILGISANAVAQRLSRARRRLRAIYLQQNPPDETSGGTTGERSDGDE
jgi:RNA polymerase sigma-70 factor (ECF subfamily)